MAKVLIVEDDEAQRFLHHGENMKPLMEYVFQDDVKRAKDLIVKAMQQD